MEIKHDPSQFKNKKVLIKNPEVIAFNISSSIYPIKSFSAYKTTFFINGMSFFMFYKDEKGYLVYKESLSGDFFDYQELFIDKNPKDNRSFCELDYRN